MRLLAWGAAATALLSCSALAAQAPRGSANHLEAPAWAIAPADTSCHTDVELTGRSGDAVVVQLESDGERVALRFPRGEIPDHAFLPIRIDGKPFSNLVQGGGDARTASMILSDETLAALRKGQTLQVAWLGDEALKSSLSGAPQGLSDLRTCGAQVAAQAHVRAQQQAQAQARAEAEARDRAVGEEQLRAARAQTLAAEAEQRRLAAEADKATAEAKRQRSLAEADRQRAALDAQRQREAAAEQAEAQQAYAYPYPYRRASRYPVPQDPAPYGYYRSPYDPN